PHPALALAGWCPLSPAGAQTTQLLVQPPWTPPVLWDHVTLTCHGLGTAAATTWYKDGQRWRLQGPDRFRVTQSGTYQCHRPDTGLSPPVSVSNDRLVLQVPARALLVGDTVTLRCRGWQDNPVASVSFYREEKQLQPFRNRTELSLSPLQLHHSGRYRCSGSRSPRPISFPELFPVPVLEGPPEPTEGSPLNLSCLSTPSPLRPRAPLLHLFYRHGRLVGGPQGSPQLLLPAVGVSHSGNYSCQVRSERGPVLVGLQGQPWVGFEEHWGGSGSSWRVCGLRGGLCRDAGGSFWGLGEFWGCPSLPGLGFWGTGGLRGTAVVQNFCGIRGAWSVPGGIRGAVGIRAPVGIWGTRGWSELPRFQEGPGVSGSPRSPPPLFLAATRKPQDR
uniref:Uncharacterized protein n=1 Tax=Corvus moneduloides TaxID=1196302 RepID=A0A8U7NUS8_CORMO